MASVNICLDSPDLVDDACGQRRLRQTVGISRLTWVIRLISVYTQEWLTASLLELH